jgi:hypothetical protein
MNEINDRTPDQPGFGPRVSRSFDLVGLIPLVLICGSLAAIFIFGAVRAVAEDGPSALFLVATVFLLLVFEHFQVWPFVYDWPWSPPRGGRPPAQSFL